MAQSTTTSRTEATQKNESALTRLNVNLNQETADALRLVAEQRGISFTEAVRRAISVYKFVEDELAEGHRVQAVDADSGTVRELVLL